MKTLNKITLTIIALLVCITIFNGCKKADLKAPGDIAPDAANIAKLRENVTNQMAKEGGIPQIFTRQQPVTTMWVDQNRNPLTIAQMQNNNFTSQCSFNLPSFCNLVQYSRVYRCASTSNGPAGYFLQFEFEMSWDNKVIKNAGGGNLTSGHVDIVDGSNNVVQFLDFDYTNSDVQIIDMGADPDVVNYPNNEVFRVKFVTTDFNTHLVSDMFINSTSYAVKFSAAFVSDCKTGGSPYYLWLVPVTSYGFTGANGDDPCQRNDKAWVTTQPTAGGSMIVGGYYAGIYTCGYAGTFITPDLQEVQYNIDGGLWTDMDNTTATGLGIANTGFIRSTDFCQVTGLPMGSHMLGLRYRNWKYGGTTTPWNLPSTGAGDCRSPINISLPSGYQDYSTWAYQYWPY